MVTPAPLDNLFGKMLFYMFGPIRFGFRFEMTLVTSKPFHSFNWGMFARNVLF
jgi:hypothetical protein